jgi:hypothetical protein
MTEAQARELAAGGPDYVAKRINKRYWGVWCTTSDDWVEFDLNLSVIPAARIEDENA